MEQQLIFFGTILLLVLVAFGTVMLIFARLYKRSSKEVSFVRTGFGGQKVIMNGGAIVLPVLHEVIPVNMNTLCLLYTSPRPRDQRGSRMPSSA